MHRSVKIRFYILGVKSFERKYLHHSTGQTGTVSVGVQGGSIPVILSGGTSIISRQRSFARLSLGGLSCSALTSRRFSRGSWQQSSARSRWNRSWPWCGRWPCPPPSRGCPPPPGGSLGWPSSAAPPLRKGSAGRKPNAARLRSVTLRF